MEVKKITTLFGGVTENQGESPALQGGEDVNALPFRRQWFLGFRHGFQHRGGF